MEQGSNRRCEQISKEKTSLEKLIHAFEVRNRAPSRSPKKIAWYFNNLRLFKEFLKANGYSLELGRMGISSHSMGS